MIYNFILNYWKCFSYKINFDNFYSENNITYNVISNFLINVIMYHIISHRYLFLHSCILPPPPSHPFISTMHCWKVLQDATGAKRVLHSPTLNVVWHYIIFSVDVRLFRKYVPTTAIVLNPFRILGINFVTFKFLNCSIRSFFVHILLNILNLIVISIHVLINF